MSGPGYFDLRRMEPESSCQGVRLPAWLPDVLGDKEERVLDVGCGLGGVLNSLREKGFRNVVGVDVDEAAVNSCKEAGLKVELISDVVEYMVSYSGQFDLVLMLHVLEHLEKKDIIPALKMIREKLSPGGRVVVSVPNAQSPTGSYWAFEDFTHSTIFTSGSLYYVLAAAGFDRIEFVDPSGIAGLGRGKALLRTFLVAMYGWSRKLLNRVAGSSWHHPSPEIYTFEVKAVAYNR
jgi:SAM-dependent methyltransferase